jgi:hypothetical protein
MKLRTVKDCIKAVSIYRKGSNREATRRLAMCSHTFGEDRQPKTRYLAVPSISSERRNYIPMAFLPPEVIASNKLLLIPDANLFHFGVLSSAIHMAWVRIVTGRLKSDIQYSVKLVYNNFPWPDRLTDERRTAVEAAAQRILDLRAELGNECSGSLRFTSDMDAVSLATLYDADGMPRLLRRAHADLDRAVEKCYRAEPFHSDRERVEHLFSLYEKLTAPLLPATPKTKGHRAKTASTPPRPRKPKTPGLYSQLRQSPPEDGSSAESWAAAAHDHGPLIGEHPPTGIPVDSGAHLAENSQSGAE